jgi:hypothetical protein
VAESDPVAERESAYKQFQVEILAWISEQSREAAEQRRWMTIQVVAIVGVVVPLLLSQTSLVPMRGPLLGACLAFVCALVVLLIWDLSDPFLRDPLIRDLLEVKEAMMDAEVVSVFNGAIGLVALALGAPPGSESAALRHKTAQETFAIRATQLRRLRTWCRVLSGVLLIVGLVLLTWALLGARPASAVTMPTRSALTLDGSNPTTRLHESHGHDDLAGRCIEPTGAVFVSDGVSDQATI